MAFSIPKRVVITGANRGIGLFLTEDILTSFPEAFVFLGSRSMEKGKEAVGTLPEECRTRVEVLEVDVGSEESVKKAAKEIEKKFPDEKHPLFGLVNNAGVNSTMKTSLDINVFGIERTTTAFASLLVPETGRVVNITSGAGPMFVSRCSREQQKFFTNQTTTPVSVASITEFANQVLPIPEGEGEEERFGEKGLGDGKKDGLGVAYGLSKALANLATIELSIRFPRLLVNACTPGLVATDMSKGLIEESGKTPEELNVVPREKSTQSALLLLFGEVGGSGCFFRSNEKKCPMDEY